MKQPISALTNIAYIAVGVALLANPVIGVSLIMLGLASFLFHATDDYWAQKADEIAIYLVLWAFIGHQISGDPVFTGVFTATMTLYMGLTHRAWDSFKTIPMLFVLLVMIKIWQIQSLLFVVPFVLGVGCAFIGRKTNADEDGLHGLWHILTAYGFYLI